MNKRGHRDAGDRQEATLGELLWFHGPALLLGTIVLFLTYSAIAAAGAGPMAEALSRMSAGRLLALSLISVAPSLCGFGLELRFSVVRYLFVGAFCAAGIYVQALQEAFRDQQEFVLIPIGGGVVGIAVAWAAGSAGLALGRRLRRVLARLPPAHRSLLIVGLAVSAAGLIVVFSTTAVFLSRPTSVESAIESRGIGDEFGPPERVVAGEGAVIHVERFGRSARRPPDLQLIVVELASGREVALIEQAIRIGIDDYDLDEVQLGQRVRFTGGYLHFQRGFTSLGGNYDLLGDAMTREHYVVIRGVWGSYNPGSIEVIE